MSNTEVVNTIAKKANVSQNDVFLVLDALIELLKETVHDKGEPVSIARLGEFSRNGYPEKYIIKFKSFIETNEEKTGV